jgi:hypothetical protein
MVAQRHLYGKISPLKWRMISGKLAEAHGVTTKPIHPFFTRI